MRVLGIDPGSRITGFGIVEEETRHRCRAVAAGTFRVGDGPLAERLEALHLSISALVVEHRPDVVAVEGIFAKIAPRSALVLGHARGVALLCAAQAKLEVHEYPPATVKRSLTQSGGASKSGVARAVSMLLGLKTSLAVDATDALAVALCHLARARLTRGIVAGTPSAWTRALAGAPPHRTTRANALLRAALKGR